MKKKIVEGNPIRVGIWGLGRAGHNMHAKELAKFPEMFKVTAVCDIIPARVDEVVKDFGCTGYTNGTAFLKDPNIDLIAVVVRSTEHVEYAIRALETGRYVFLEKPIALTESGLRKLEEAAQKYQGQLFFRQNRRFEACFNHVREIIASGLLGDVFEIKLRRHRYQARDDWQTILECGGGQINNWGPHLIDHALRLLDAPVKDIWSDFRKVAAMGDAEDHIKIIFRGTNNRMIDIEISDGVLIPSNVYEVYGTRGTLVSSDEQDIKLKYLDPKFPLPKTDAHVETMGRNTGYGHADKWPWRRETIMTKPTNGYDMEDIYKYLYRTIREGKPFPVKTQEALDVVRATLMLKKQNPQFFCKKLKGC